MTRVALQYGLWATLCFLLTSVAVYALTGSTTEEMLGLLRESIPIVIAMFVVASLCWTLFHRDGRRPGIVGYALLAIAVTLIVHFVFVGMMLFVQTPSAARFYDVGKFLSAALLGLMIHGWFTLPVALTATWLFVRRQRRGDVRKAQ